MDRTETISVYRRRISEDIELIKGHSKEIEKLNNGEAPPGGITMERWKEIIKSSIFAANEDLMNYQEKLDILLSLRMFSLIDYIQKKEDV